jgi:hypothetical protein
MWPIIIPTARTRTPHRATRKRSVGSLMDELYTALPSSEEQMAPPSHQNQSTRGNLRRHGSCLFSARFDLWITASKVKTGASKQGNL